MNDNEIKELREIVAGYARIDTELNAIQEKMREFKERHDILSAELGNLAKREKVFMDSIKEKYGKINLDEFIKYINDIS